MRFTRVSLKNFKCYADADLRLDPGVTVIHGVNGSGKSSLLEACFFALYGARALDATLEDIVTTGAEETIVELWFTHAGGEYHLKRRIRATGERPTTAECVLEAPGATYEGAQDVRAHVTELLRMDDDAFVNCAYVRQGEVNKLINATPGERQDMLDDLLQLGKLEEYRQRASKARVGVGRVRDDKQGALSQVEDQIEAKEEQDLHATLNTLQTELSDAQADIERFEEQRETARQSLEDAQAILEEYEEKRAELAEIESAIDELQETITETERERESLHERISDHRQRIETNEERAQSVLADAALDEDTNQEAVEERIETLEERDSDLRDDLEEYKIEANEHESTAENHRERATALEEQATEKRERAAELESEIEDAEAKLEERREKLEQLSETIDSQRSQFEGAPIDVGDAADHREAIDDDLSSINEELVELSTTIENKQQSIEEAEALLEAGKCPECGQDVEESPHVESLDEEREDLASMQADHEELVEKRDRLEERLEPAEQLVEAETEIERLRDQRQTVSQLIDEQADDVEAKRERLTELRETAKELDDQAETAREGAETASEAAQSARENLGEVNRKRGEIKEQRQRLERALEALETVAEAENEIERLRERRSDLAKTNEERRQRLADKRERKAELAEAVDDSQVESAREEKERAANYIEQVDGKLEALREQRDDLQSRIGGVTNEIEELESLREQRDDLQSTVDRLDSLYDETEELERMYGTLRAELRQRNVETLERMLNDTFELIYQNASYARIELDGDYELTIYQKNGEALDPEQLSGGERALFNLSLRCAIYRLLAEGIDGAAPMPPLVLDEPTVFLDSGHVSQLVALVERMRELGVEQIVVVSHDEELIGAADDLVHVEKDPTTNRSRVDRIDAAAMIEPT